MNGQNLNENAVTGQQEAARAKQPKKHYSRTVALIRIRLVAAVAVTMVIRHIQNSRHEVTESRTTVEVCTPEKRDIEIYTDQIGSITPAEFVAVIPMLTGEILEVNFNVGDRVQEGDVLVRINSDALDSLQIQVDSAKMQMEDAQKALERIEALFPTGAVSQQTLEQTRSAAQGAKLAYEAAQNQYDLQVKYMNVTAPISGVIESRSAEVHEFAAPASPVCVISAGSGTVITFGAAGESAAVLKAGEQVKVESGGKTYTATVTEIGSMVSASGLHQVKADIEDGRDLTTGSRAKVTLIKERSLDTLSIPMSAVYYAGGNAFVYVFENDTAVKRDFTPGLNSEDYIEVLEGLGPEDRVICTWAKELYNGAAVVLAADGQ